MNYATDRNHMMTHRFSSYKRSLVFKDQAVSGFGDSSPEEKPGFLLARTTKPQRTRQENASTLFESVKRILYRKQ
jgi:hypothetical protein